MSADKPRRLGRGLDALIPGSGSPAAPQTDLQRIAVSAIFPNQFQPRRAFEPTELAELQASLAANGLLQPITVRAVGDRYELVAGERRMRAATGLGWMEIPALVREFDDRTMLVLALVENLQRASLNAIEEARGYRRLVDDFQLTQQEVAEVVGKDRTTVTNSLRILTLPQAVQDMVEQGAITSGHARALLALGGKHSPTDLARRAVAQGLSVRELEKLVREVNDHATGEPRKKNGKPSSRRGRAPSGSPTAGQIEDDLRRYLQTDVRVHATADFKGKVEIFFYSADDLERVLDLVLRESRRDF